MVIPDLSAPTNEALPNTKPASVMDRFLAGAFDIILLVPIATFVPALHLREARADYIQGFESNIWYQIILLWALTYIVVQTIFLYFTKTTPGGMIMHTRVRALNGELTWNQCLLRSTFSLLSYVFLCLPFLEIITHPVRRAWHDRVSDTIVLDLKSKPFAPGLNLNVQAVRFVMILGIFFVLVSMNAFMTGQDDFNFIPDEASNESTDSFVAQALLKKDFSEDTQNEVEERIWGSGKRTEKALAYFFKLQVEKNEDVKKALADQICLWVQSEKAGSLCSLARYSLKNDKNTIQALSQNLSEVKGLTSKVFVLKELTKSSQYAAALKVYEQIKKQSALTASFQDSLKIWDVSLFWALRENQLKAKRVPASVDESTAIKKYVEERGLP